MKQIILEKVCTNKGIDSDKYSLYYNNKRLDDLSLSLRYANILLNSELNLVYNNDENNKSLSTTIITISIQYSDKLRKTGKFNNNEQTLWEIILNLFNNDEIPELNNLNDYIFTINLMNKQFDGNECLKKTKLKTLGLNKGGRYILRLNCRSINDLQRQQKFVENIQFKKNIKEKETIINEKIDDKVVDIKPVVEEKPIVIDDDGGKKLTTTTESNEIQAKSVPMIDTNESKDNKVKNDDQNIEKLQIEKEIDTKPEIHLLGGNNDELFYSLDEQIKFIDEELPDEFFEHTANDLKHLLKELRKLQKQSDDYDSDLNSVLETKELREKREQQKRQKFNQTILRIIFPYDRLVMQAIFHPNDTIEDVINVINKYLIINDNDNQSINIDLFVTPPRTILNRESNLYDLKLVPCGIVYCTSSSSSSSSINNNQKLIRNEFKNILNTFNNVNIYLKNKKKN